MNEQKSGFGGLLPVGVEVKEWKNDGARKYQLLNGV